MPEPTASRSGSGSSSSSSSSSGSSSSLELLRDAVDCAGAGLDARPADGPAIPLAVAPACERCRRQTPAIYLRCHAEVRPRLGAGESHHCAHGQGLKVAAGGAFLVVAPARRIGRVVALVERLTAAGGEGFRAGFSAGGALEDTVRSLVAAIDAKDPYTRGHSERVHIAATFLGERLGLDPDTRADLYWASLLHDVGKIGAPEHILRKPGKLTPSEYIVMQEHPARGDAVLEPLGWLAGARRGVRHHHERLDGGGYPDGLRGDAIPLIARVIAVADTFDSVTSRRPYRDERGPERALEILEQAAGTQLDPTVVAGFARHFEAILAALLAAGIPPEGLLAAPDVAAAAAAAAAAAEPLRRAA